MDTAPFKLKEARMSIHVLHSGLLLYSSQSIPQVSRSHSGSNLQSIVPSSVVLGHHANHCSTTVVSKQFLVFHREYITGEYPDASTSTSLDEDVGWRPCGVSSNCCRVLGSEPATDPLPCTSYKWGPFFLTSNGRHGCFFHGGRRSRFLSRQN
jgi:hypothetical protein